MKHFSISQKCVQLLEVSLACYDNSSNILLLLPMMMMMIIGLNVLFHTPSNSRAGNNSGKKVLEKKNSRLDHIIQFGVESTEKCTIMMRKIMAR